MSVRLVRSHCDSSYFFLYLCPLETDLLSAVLLGLSLYFMHIVSTFLDIKYIYDPPAHLVVGAYFAEFAFAVFAVCSCTSENMHHPSITLDYLTLHCMPCVGTVEAHQSRCLRSVRR